MSSVLSFMGWLLCIQRKRLLLHSGKVSEWDLDQFVQSAFFLPVLSIVTALTAIQTVVYNNKKTKITTAHLTRL